MLRKSGEHGRVSALVVIVGPGDMHEGVQPMEENVKLGWLQSQPEVEEGQRVIKYNQTSPGNLHQSVPDSLDYHGTELREIFLQRCHPSCLLLSSL